MKYFRSVLAFGDSHVAGCELSDELSLDDYTSGKVSIEQADAVGKKFAFPKLVADHLTLPCYNYAMTGGSNARSIRKLIQAVQEHPNALVLFGYTCTDRTELYYPDKGNYLGRDSDNFIQVGMQWEGAIKNAKMKHPINDMFVNKMLRAHNNLNEMMFIVDSICTLNAIQVIHLPLFPENTAASVELFNYEGCNNYIEWCAKNKFTQMPYLHYYKDAHAALANLIIGEL